MWPRSPRSSTFGNARRGAVAFLLVLGVTSVLLLLGAVVAHAARQELRLSRVEGTAEQIAILVESGFNEAAKRADGNDTWPTQPFGLGSARCVPAAPYPSYCIDAMARRPMSGTERSIPIRVTYRLSATAEIGESFGWIVVDLKTNPTRVTRILPHRYWCVPAAAGSGTGPCALGG